MRALASIELESVSYFSLDIKTGFCIGSRKKEILRGSVASGFA